MTAASRDERDDTVRIRPADVADAGEILTIQRAAFVTEALIYADVRQPAFVQTLEELEAELHHATAYVSERAGRIVGALRASIAGDLLQIGRIAIAPDVQGEGIGRALLEHAETSSGCVESELFTGSLSEANIRLYESCGYVESDRVDNGDGTAQVFLRKRLD